MNAPVTRKANITQGRADGAVRDYRKRTLTPTTMEAALRLTESNLTSLINAQHHDAVLMSDWRKVVREALGWTQGDF